MSFVKAISGFIFGLVACGILLFLISVRSPISSPPPATDSSSIETAPATGDSVENGATDTGENGANSEAETVSEPSTAPESNEEPAPAEPAPAEPAPNENDSGSTSTPPNTQIGENEPEQNLQKPSLVGVPETVSEVEQAIETPTFTETLPSQDEFNQTEPEQVAINTTKPAVRIGTGIGEKSNSGLPTIGGEESQSQLFFESEANKEETNETPGDVFGAFDVFSQEYISEDKPLLAIVLQDMGRDGLNRADLLKADFSASFAISGDMLDSKRAASEYYEAGFEVLVENPMNAGANVAQSDDAKALTENYLSAVPTAIAFIDNPNGNLQKSHGAQKQVLDTLAQSGHAIISYKRGLDPTQREAAKRDMQAGAVFRVIDGNGEDAQGIFNNLNRAIFQANQDGSAIVYASGNAATFDAIQSWVQSGKASGVSIVPVSAAIRKQGN